MKLFVYGTLKRGQANHNILKPGKFIDTDAIEGWEMRSTMFFPAINEKKGVFVTGEVYEINPEILKKTDRLEGFPLHYSKKMVKTVGGHDVWVYYYKEINRKLEVIKSGCWD